MGHGDAEAVTVGVHEFPEEVLVEVTRRNEDGHLVVHSFQFDYAEDGLVPVEPVPEDFAETVRTALREDGYSLAAD